MQFNKIKNITELNKIIFIGFSIVLLVTMMFMSRNAGISGDEYFHVDHAEKVFNYYKTFGKDTLALNDSEGLLHLYGQSLDNEVHFFNEWFNVEDIYQSRHIFNSIIGWLLILFSALIMVLIKGWRAGIITLVLLFFSPKLLGHSWNNLKDLPFATAYIFTIYFILKFIKDLPRNNYLALVFTTLGIAWAISLRIGGIILIPYLFLFVGIYYITKKSFYTKTGFIVALKKLMLLVLVGIFAYFIGLILWPFAIQNPFKNPLISLKEMTNYGMGIVQLFEGKLQVSKELPWYYGLKYIVITSPIIVFIGLFVFLVTIPFRKEQKTNYLFYSFLFFAFAFPIGYTIFKGSNLYGGWRHLLWTYSPIVILSAIGFEYFLNKKSLYIKYGTAAFMVFLLWHPVKHTFKNHPHQYIYYNQLVGGVDGAYGEFEMDYYYHSLKAGADWFIKNELSSDSITVATNHSRIVEYYFREYPQVDVVYSRYYEKGALNWNYAIWANTHITPLQLEKGYWPPKETLHTVNVDSTPVTAVVKRISDEDFKGYKALLNNNQEKAKKHFKAFLKIYPENELALEGYARACLMEKMPDSTIIYADSSLLYNPRQIGALFLKASALNIKKEFKKTIQICDEMIKLRRSFAEAYYQKGVALKNLNKPNEALVELKKAASNKKDYYEAYMQMGSIFMNHKQYDDAINSIYNKVLQFKKNDLYAMANKAKCYHFLKQNNISEKIIEEIPIKNHNHFDVVKLKTRIEMEKGNLNFAAQLLNLTGKIDNNSEIFVIRAIYVLRKNNKELAKQFLERAIELSSINREAKELLEQIQSTEIQKTTQIEQAKNQQKSIMFQEDSKKKQNPINLLQNK